MITWNNVADLLATAAVFDQRRADELDIRAWLEIATLHRWSPAAARRVIIEHYGHGSDRPRITPAAITDRIREIRRRGAETFQAPPLPAGLAPKDYPAWLRQRRDAHVDALVERWSVDGQMPSSPAAVEPARIRTVAALIAAAPPEVQSQLRSAARRVAPRPPLAEADTERRRAEARAELAATRPRDEQELTS